MTGYGAVDTPDARDENADDRGDVEAPGRRDEDRRGDVLGRHYLGEEAHRDAGPLHAQEG